MQSKSSNNGSSSASSKRYGTFDTLAIVQDLGKAGVDKPMAVAIVKALQATSEFIRSDMVSRQDFAEFKGEMNVKFADFKGQMRTEMRAEMNRFLFAMTGLMTFILTLFMVAERLLLN